MVRRVIAILDGRESPETLRAAAGDGTGDDLGHPVEYAVLDRAGRLQLPREMTEALGMRDRVRLEQNPDHIGVWADSADRNSPDRNSPDRNSPDGHRAEGTR